MAAVALVTVLAATGCSLLPGSRQSDSPSQAPATSEPAASPSAGGTASGSPATTPGATPAPTTAPTGGAPGDQQLGPVVASRTTTVDGKSLRMELHPLVRDGNLTHLQLRVSSDSAEGLRLRSTFSDTNSTAGDRSDWAADGITLVDTARNKLYLVASDGRGTCLCSRRLVAVEVKNNLPVVIAASFATPPAEMTDIQVQIPNFGVFPHVPIS